MHLARRKCALGQGLGDPTVDEAGQVTGAVGVAVGIDEPRAGRRAVSTRSCATAQRADVLRQATQAIGSSLEFDELVDNISVAVVPGMSDWCRLTLLINDGGATHARRRHQPS